VYQYVANAKRNPGFLSELYEKKYAREAAVDKVKSVVGEMI